MNNILVGLVITFMTAVVNAETIASMPNQAGGKIVLTDEVCKIKNKTFAPLYRLYMYTSEGLTSEGCYYIEDETVMSIWDMSYGVEKRRYPLNQFTATRRKSI